MSEIHELPLANRLVDDEIRQWLDRHLGLQLATYDPGSEAAKAVEQARHLHLDNYSYTVTPAILDALQRAGLVGEAARSPRLIMLGTCDWGDCDEPGIAIRWSLPHGYLPVCYDHIADDTGEAGGE